MTIHTWYHAPNYYIANYNYTLKHFEINVTGRDDALHLAKMWLLMNKLEVI